MSLYIVLSHRHVHVCEPDILPESLVMRIPVFPVCICERQRRRAAALPRRLNCAFVVSIPSP